MATPLRALITVGTVVLAAAPIAGQAAPTSRDLYPHLLRLGVDSFSVYSIRRADTMLIGWARDELHKQGGRLTRIYLEVDSIFGTWSDTIVSDARDLSPLWHSMGSSWFNARLRFSKTSVSGWAQVSDSTPVAVRYQLTEPVDDPAMFDVIARASSLQPAFHLEGSAFDVATRTVKPFRGGVTGSATLNGRPCWVFTGNNGGIAVVFWIDKSSRALVQSVVRFRRDFSLLLIAEDL